MTGYLVTVCARKRGAIGSFEFIRFKVIAIDKSNALYQGRILTEEKSLETNWIMAHRLDKLSDASQNDIIMMVRAREV